VADYFGAMGTALYSTLSGGTALVTELGGTAIYAEQAPDGASLPYIVFSHQAGMVQNITHSNLRDDTWFVRGYAATRAQANRIDGLVEGLLHKKTLTVSGFTNFWTVKTEQVAFIENPPSGTRVYMAGGMYQIRLTGA
jgi:hypothetical protein